MQIATFLGNISDKFQAFPALVVVPNSTITNWVREFERWAPNLRVVPFYGEAKARDVIKRFELSHEFKRAGETGAKFHVLVTTYEAFTNPKDFTLFKSQPRWEVNLVFSPSPQTLTTYSFSRFSSSMRVNDASTTDKA